MIVILALCSVTLLPAAQLIYFNRRSLSRVHLWYFLSSHFWSYYPQFLSSLCWWCHFKELWFFFCLSVMAWSVCILGSRKGWMCLTVSFNCLMFCRPRQNPCGKAEDGMSQRSLLSPSTWEQGLPRQELAQEQECEVGLLPACILLGGNTRCLTSVS